MRLTDAVPRAMATTHYRAAARLGRRLAEFSNTLRGHIAAPGPEVDVAEKDGMIPKPLLIKGDHELSYRWVSEPDFRFAIAERLQAEGRQRGARPPKLPATLLRSRT
jgi:hypothetical protein